MKSLRHDPEQRFTCGRCTRCCWHFDVAVTAEEAERLRRPAVARLWSARAPAPEPSESALPDPVEVAPRGLPRLRRRSDGACGFLAEDGACRIHAGPGPDHKPLACRIFPFRVHETEGTPLVTASFSCPTVARNEGEPLSKQLAALQPLAQSWRRAFPEEKAALLFAGRRPLASALAGDIRGVLQQILERRPEDGRRDLRDNVGRIAALVEDWSRPRVLALADDDFAEYVRLTGGFAARSDKPAIVRRPSVLGRLQLRGFLLAAVAGRMQARGPRRGLRLGLRFRLARIALHLHGLGPAIEGIDRAAAHRMALALDAPQIHDRVHHFLRSTLETLPTGARSLLDELAWAFATLHAAAQLAAMRAAAQGRSAVEEDDFVEGLATASDLGQAGTSGPLGAILGSLTGGLEALRAFAARP